MTTRKPDPAKSETRFYVVLALVVIFMAVMFFDSKSGARELQNSIYTNQAKLNADIPKGEAREADWEEFRKEEDRLDKQTEAEREDITNTRHALFAALGLIVGLLGGREISGGSKEEEAS